MDDPLRPSRPGPFDLGRLNVAPTVEPPNLTDCRWCSCELLVRRTAVYCPACDQVARSTR